MQLVIDHTPKQYYYLRLSKYNNNLQNKRKMKTLNISKSLKGYNKTEKEET